MKPTSDPVAHPEPQIHDKHIIPDNIPIEELLGSVTTYNNVDGSETKSQQLRTSARVFKKMKLDSANAAAAPPPQPPVPEKKESPPAKEEVKPPETKKPFRTLWSPEDKSLFFEALNEYGKDFEQIHLYISNKLKKKGVSESVIKTKEQIRHLYYRTWHKISKHLKFSSEIKKIPQELYALINYGELRRKVGSVSEKNCVKLNELMYTGTVAVRHKGKTVRIKTPMCKALRRLNQLDENQEDLKLPTRVLVELKPKDMKSYLKVQSLAQNPLIRTAMPLQKRLSSFMSSLREKWKSPYLTAYQKTLSSVNNVTMVCMPDSKTIEECTSTLDPPLRLTPPADANIEVPGFNLMEYLNCQSVCLNVYEERVGIKIHGEQLCSSLWASYKSKGGSKRGGTKRQRHESASEKLASANKLVENAEKIVVSTSTDNNENCLMDCDLQTTSFSNVVDEAVNTILALKSQEAANSKTDEKATESTKTEVKEDVNNAEAEKKEHDINLIKKGWTLDNCGTLCIGELYLMFGSEGKLVLEYAWDNSNQTDSKLNQTIKAEAGKESDSVNTDSENEQKDDKLTIGKENEINMALQRLLSVAKLHYRKNMIKCPCGHVCGGPPKTTTSTSKPKSLATKSNKPVSNSSVATPESEKTPDKAQARTPPITPCVPITPYTQNRQITPNIALQRQNSLNSHFFRAQIESIQRLRPRFCSRRGRRPRLKQVVVERKLPVIANKADADHKIVQMNIISQDKLETIPRMTATVVDSEPTCKIVQMSIISQDELKNNTSRIITPEIGQGETFISDNMANVAVLGADMPSIEEPTSALPFVALQSSGSEISLTPVDISDNAIMSSSRVSSPTSISNLLDMALGSDGGNIILGNGAQDNKDNSGIPSFAGFLSENIPSSTTTPPSSPSRILKENENQWLNSEVADFSLSSFLGHLESPMKPTQSTSSIVEDESRMSMDVDAQLQSLLTESSIDYTAKFADLAAQVVSDNKKL